MTAPAGGPGCRQQRAHTPGTTGRTIAVAFGHGEDFYTALDQASRAHDIRQGYIPMFIAGLATADLVGTCEHLADPGAPVWSKVQLTNVEALDEVRKGGSWYRHTTLCMLAMAFLVTVRRRLSPRSRLTAA